MAKTITETAFNSSSLPCHICLILSEMDVDFNQFLQVLNRIRRILNFVLLRLQTCK